MSIGRSTILRLASMPLVERMVRRSWLFRPLVKRFIAGETVEDAMVRAEEMCERGLLVSLDYLGENVATEPEATAAKEAYIAMLRRIAESPHAAKINISIKLTQCGFDIDDEFTERNLREVLAVAHELGNFVRVDMEASTYTERTVAMIERVFPELPVTGTVLQSYLYRTPDDLRRMLAIGARVRLVKGAYLEPANVAYPQKSKVDSSYVDLMKTLLCEGNYPAIATHDVKMIDATKRFVAERSIAPERFEFQMIYGVRRDLQESLMKEGYNMRVYIPFGNQWYPYFTRRLAERPANTFFILKSLFRG